jgi:hypothetical protein
MPRQNPRTRDIKARAMAIDMLVAVRAWPHINREEIFESALAYFRWKLTFPDEEGMLAAYTHEFLHHHDALMADLDLALQQAAFVVWFAANGLHRLPLISVADATNEQGQRVHFSSPCFHLPTDTRDDTFLMQWLRWRESLPETLARPQKAQIYQWSRGLATRLPDYCMLNRDALTEQCSSFFAWGFTDGYSLDTVRACMIQFARDQAGEVPIDDPDLWDAHFLIWFAGRVLCHADRKGAS